MVLNPNITLLLVFETLHVTITMTIMVIVGNDCRLEVQVETKKYTSFSCKVHSKRHPAVLAELYLLKVFSPILKSD